jgi:hypothetical protein
MRIIRNGASVLVWVQCRLSKLFTIIYCESSILDIIRRPRIAMCDVFPDCHRPGEKVEGTARFNIWNRISSLTIPQRVDCPVIGFIPNLVPNLDGESCCVLLTSSKEMVLRPLKQYCTFHD